MRLWLYLVLSVSITLGVEGSAPSRGPAGCRLGPFLRTLADAHKRKGAGHARKVALARGLKLRQGLVPVILEPLPGQGSDSIDLASLDKQGLRVHATSRSFVRILVPFGRLKRLEGLAGIYRARAPTQAKALGGMGTYISESVALTGADDVQTAEFDGTGVKVAVVDLGFYGAGSALGAGELPTESYVVILPGQSSAYVQSGTEHGTAVSEHVADMAPGVTLYLIRTDDEVDLQNAADYMESEGIRVANHSVGWVGASYYDDTGPMNDIINESRDTDGVFWAVAAGNDAKRHWRGTWTDSDGDGWLEFDNDSQTPVDDREENGLAINSYGITVWLNWNQYGGSITDLDLVIYKVKNNGTLSEVDRSDNVQTGTEQPVEAVGLTPVPNTKYVIKVCVKDGTAAPPADLDITLFCFNQDFDYPVAASSLMDPANAHGAFSVAAVDQADWSGAEPAPEPFSSQGPTNRGQMKPDLTAPDGTQSYIYGASYGTSFSSPTTAGAAALILHHTPGATADQIAAKLKALAVDVGETGEDYVYGAGKLCLRGLLAQLSIDSVQVAYPADPDDVPKYSKLELLVNMSNVAATRPYLGDASAGGLDLSATFDGPGGRSYTVPGFYDGTNWRVRFAPDAVGDWAFTVTATDKSGTADPVGGSFSCTASAHPGWVRVDGHYLRFTEGQVFFGVGHNNGWQYDLEQPTFADMASGGENLLSFWMAVPWALPSWTSEPEPYWDDRSAVENPEGGIGNYNQAACGYIDGLIDRAEAAGVYLQPTIWSHGQLRDVNHPWSGANPDDNNWWYNNPYNTLSSVTDFFKTVGVTGDTRQWRYQKNYYRYILARWGYSRAISSWVALCEADGTTAYGGDSGYRDQGQVEAWCGAVRSYFADNDPYRTNASGETPLTVSKLNAPSWTGGFAGGFDLRSTDHYDWGADEVQIAQDLANETATMWASGKPAFHAEFGGAISEGDTQPTHLHNGVWAGAAAGAAIAPLVWCDGGDWTLLTADMQDHLKYLGEFMAGIDYLGNAGLGPSSLSVGGGCLGWGMSLADRGYAWVQNPSGDMGGQTLTISGLAEGTYDVSWYNTWDVGTGAPAAFSTGPATVGGDGNLTVFLPVLTRPDIAMKYAMVLNQAPVANGDSYSVDEDGELVVAAPGVLDDDSDPNGDPLTAILVAGPAHGELTLNSDGSFTYTPEADYVGPDSFTYKANDGQEDSNEAAVSITVAAVNDRPVIECFTPGTPITIAAGTTETFEVFALDPDGDALSFSWKIDGAPVPGTESSLDYSPTLGDLGAHTIRVIASDGNGLQIGQTWKVTVLLAAPATIGPWGSTPGSIPTFSWNAVAGATGYDVQLRTAAGTFIEAISTSDTSVARSAPLAAGDYKWCVRAKNAQGPGIFSAYVSFSMVPLSAPVTIGPWGSTPGSIPTFSWNAVAGATGYDVQLRTAAGTFIEAISTSETSVARSAPLAAGDYKWCARARNAQGPGIFSAYVSFSMVPLTAPTPVAPSGTTTGTKPTFSWNAVAGATGYDVQLRKADGTFVKAMSTTETSVQSTVKLAAGNHKWRVRAKSNAGPGDFSSYASFQVDPLAAPAQLAPSGAAPGGAYPTFSWNAVAGATEYNVIVRRADGAFIVVLKTVGTSVQCTKALNLGQQYKWAILARNGEGPGLLSGYVVFTPQP